MRLNACALLGSIVLCVSQLTWQLLQHNCTRVLTRMSVAFIIVGPLDPTGRDALLIGTGARLIAHDVENKSDVFYRVRGAFSWVVLAVRQRLLTVAWECCCLQDISDGVSALCVGVMGREPSPVAVVGGTCSVQAIDWDGADQWWTVAGACPERGLLCMGMQSDLIAPNASPLHFRW